jgi:hypothetical protein
MADREDDEGGPSLSLEEQEWLRKVRPLRGKGKLAVSALREMEARRISDMQAHLESLRRAEKERIERTAKVAGYKVTPSWWRPARGLSALKPGVKALVVKDQTLVVGGALVAVLAGYLLYRWHYKKRAVAGASYLGGVEILGAG